MELSGVSVNTIPTFQLTAPRMKFPNTLHVAPTTRTVRYSIGYYGRVKFGNHRRNAVVLRHRHRLQLSVMSIARRTGSFSFIKFNSNEDCDITWVGFVFYAIYGAESQRIKNLVFTVVFIIYFAFKIASASTEKIGHSFKSLNVKFVFSNTIAIQTPSYDLKRLPSVYEFVKYSCTFCVVGSPGSYIKFCREVERNKEK
ncbi:hypothetical protein QTP88_005115 [Uroleucon formosanum]